MFVSSLLITLRSPQLLLTCRARPGRPRCRLRHLLVFILTSRAVNTKITAAVRVNLRAGSTQLLLPEIKDLGEFRACVRLAGVALHYMPLSHATC